MRSRYAIAALLFLLCGAALAGPERLLPGGGGKPATGIAESDRSTDFTLPDLDGRPVTLGRYLGKKPVLLVFWATWCPECKAAIPEINAMTTEPLAGKLQILGLDFKESREMVANAVEARGIRYIIAAPILREGTVHGRVPAYNQPRSTTVAYNTLVNNGGIDLVIGGDYKSGWPRTDSRYFDAVFLSRASFTSVIPLRDSSTDLVNDSRARAGLWKPSEFSAVHHSQRTCAFWCSSCASLITSGGSPAFFPSTILSIRAESQNSALRIFPLVKFRMESIS